MRGSQTRDTRTHHDTVIVLIQYVRVRESRTVSGERMGHFIGARMSTSQTRFGGGIVDETGTAVECLATIGVDRNQT